MIAGIDLGTRNAFCSCVGESGSPIVIPNRWGQLSTNSVVAWTDNGFIAGDDAWRMENSQPQYTWWDIKRKICTSWRAHTPDGVELQADEVIVPLIRLLREDIEAFCKCFVDSCALAVPACFDLSQRAAMARAAVRAGFTNVRVINEPTAAALSFISHGENGRFLVLDFGAGTVDVSVVECEGNVWQVLDSVGASNIGGYDFDVLLAEWLMQRLSLESDKDSEVWRMFRTEAERIKITLSSCRSYEWYPLPVEGRNFSPVTILREDFDRLIRFHVQRVVNWVSELWERYSPSLLLLVGGSSRLPILRDIINCTIDAPIGICPDECVAIGACYYSMKGRERLLLDALSDDIILKDDAESILVFAKGTPLPVSDVRVLSGGESGRKNVVVSQNNVDIYSSELSDIRAGEEIFLRLTVDSSGLLRGNMSRASGQVTIINPMSLENKDDSEKTYELLRKKISLLLEKLTAEQQEKLLSIMEKVSKNSDNELLSILEKLADDLEKQIL